MSKYMKDIPLKLMINSCNWMLINLETLSESRWLSATMRAWACTIPIDPYQICHLQLCLHDNKISETKRHQTTTTNGLEQQWHIQCETGYLLICLFTWSLENVCLTQKTKKEYTSNNKQHSCPKRVPLAQAAKCAFNEFTNTVHTMNNPDSIMVVYSLSGSTSNPQPGEHRKVRSEEETK